jgi:host factor-I protein
MSNPADAAGGVSHLQETFLNGARRERLRVVIRLMDGTEVDGRIKSFDRFSVLVEHDGADHMLFKHAIASIRPFAIGAPDAAP